LRVCDLHLRRFLPSINPYLPHTLGQAFSEPEAAYLGICKEAHFPNSVLIFPGWNQQSRQHRLMTLPDYLSGVTRAKLRVYKGEMIE